MDEAIKNLMEATNIAAEALKDQAKTRILTEGEGALLTQCNRIIKMGFYLNQEKLGRL